MTSITDHLIKLQELTQANLDILQTLNDAMYSKKNHLAVNVGDRTYAIPSFIALENKINSLQENFENLVNSPLTGEAYFNFDGNSRSIEVRGYSHTPNSITLKNVGNFSVETNNIFKDFLTPNPYINIGLSELPNDITTVMIKKIIPIHEDLIQLFKGELTTVVDKQTTYKTSSQYMYKDLYKILTNYQKDIDYIEYDTKTDLPVRNNIGSATYVIQDIIEDVIDENLDEYITIKFRNDVQDDSISNKLSYKLFNETIEKLLVIGDKLVTFDDSAKMEITDIQYNTNTITVKVLNGEYLNLIKSTSNKIENIHSLNKLKFFSPIDFDKDKYVKVSLEEDKYVFISVAALNNRLNIQSPWGTGLIINTYNLLYDGNNKDSFETYYKNNIRNVGDVLYEITSMMSNTLTNYSKDQFETFTTIKPVINESDLLVTQINKHLNNTPTISNIRSLYSQKKEYENRLNEINIQINTINEKLSEISFDDTSNIKTVYISQLSSLSTEQNKINTSIIKIVNSIAEAANNSEIPIENAKYRIRGFFDCKNFLISNNLTDILNNHVRGIKVQYRYKNILQEQGNAMSINGKFIFSDWIDMDSINRQRVPYFEDTYKYKLEEDNSNINEPSFNQIDIPITQGETVDIRLKVVYDLGWPYVYTTSDWSEIVNIKFPEEYIKDVQILDIIKENNDDIETNRFNNIIKETGIIEHINGKINDQDITYYHKPEDIASGFYTDERRIIPLKDKLSSMNSMITELYDVVYGSHNDNIEVSVINGDIVNTLQPYISNNISVSSYDMFKNIESEQSNQTSNEISIGNYIYNTQSKLVTTLLNIKLTNASDHTMKLYSIFPGSRDAEIKDLVHIKYGIYKEEYVDGNDGVFGLYEEENTDIFVPQYANQYITFRIKDVNNNENYYVPSNCYNNNYISSKKEYFNYNICESNSGVGPLENCAFMYPVYPQKKYLCLDSDTLGSYKLLNPGDYINIPIAFEYRINDDSSPTIISKTMSFDIRTSLYKDPITYTFKVTAKSVSTTQDKIISVNSNLITKYNSVYK